MTATDPVQAVAEALAEHNACGHCEGECGACRSDAEVAVAAARPLIAAEALREAADSWQTGGWADDLPPAGASRVQLILGMSQRACNWLRGRADAIEADIDKDRKAQS